MTGPVGTVQPAVNFNTLKQVADITWEIEMIRIKKPSMIVLVTLILPAMMVAGCGGSNTNPTTPPTCLTFVPTQLPAAQTITSAIGSSTCSSLTLNLMVMEVDDLWGGGAVIRFPSDLVNFAGADVINSTLAQDGNPVEVLGIPGDVEEVSPTVSEVTVAITRVGANEPGIDVGAMAEVLLRISFVMGNGTGTGQIELLDPELLDVIDPNIAPQPVPYVVTGHGGTVRVGN